MPTLAKRTPVRKSVVIRRSLPPSSTEPSVRRSSASSKQALTGFARSRGPGLQVHAHV
jgi:hypothetical protein